MVVLSTPDALAKVLGPCPDCRGRGYVLPYCSACSDSTYDHDCPESEVCEHPRLLTKVDALLASGAVIDAAALADDETLVQAFRDGWEAADARGESGSRVKAGLRALAAALSERDA